MLHHTKDPGVRAADIADREAEEVWQKTGNARKSDKVWRETYHSALKEFMTR